MRVHHYHRRRGGVLDPLVHQYLGGCRRIRRRKHRIDNPAQHQATIANLILARAAKNADHLVPSVGGYRHRYRR